MTERLFVRDRVQIDSTKIEEYEHDIFGLVTVFKDVVIAREIVHEYTDGMAWKPANELKESFWTAEGRWAKAGDHPTDGIIMDRNSINGRTVNLRFTKSLKDPKTRRTDNRGILADLEVFNRTVSAQLLQDMKSGKASDVSIGFFFSKDGTAGVIDDGALKGTPYDYVQRNLSIDHVAYGLDAGRCPMPYCGIGSDELLKIIRKQAALLYGTWNDILDTATEDYRDGYSLGLRRYDALQHLSSIHTCYTSIRQKHVLQPTQQHNAKSDASQSDAHHSLKSSTELELHSSWNNIFDVLKEGVQIHDCKICKQILSACNDDVSFLSDFANSIDLHKWLSKNASLVYNQRGTLGLPFHTVGMIRAHVLLLETAQDCPFSTYQYIGRDKNILTLREVIGDPFGKWETFEECVKDIMRQNPDYTRKQAEGTCAVIEQRSKEKHKSDATISKHMNETLEEVKVYLKDILSKLDALEPVEEIELEDGDEGINGEDAGPRTEAERAMAHFDISKEAWEALSPEEKQEYIDKLPPKGSMGDGGDEGDIDEECLDCDDEQEEDNSSPPAEDVIFFDVEASQKITERTKAKLKELDIK